MIYQEISSSYTKIMRLAKNTTNVGRKLRCGSKDDAMYFIIGDLLGGDVAVMHSVKRDTCWHLEDTWWCD